MDPWFIVSAAPKEARLIRTAREVNDEKPEWVINKVRLAIAGYLKENPKKESKNVVVACFGITFKADIDDLRESPAYAIAKKIAEEHTGSVWVVEPNIEKLPAHPVDIFTLKSFDEARECADILLLLVDHKEFKSISPDSIGEKIVIDTRGIWR
ncbi:UDP-N-acetyl-D-mannosamine dehydrogenase [compost metagenome]